MPRDHPGPRRPLRRPRVLAALLLSLAVGCPLAAGDEQEDRRAAESRFVNERYPLEFRKRVNAAIDKGIGWLRGQQARDGSFPSSYNRAYPMGPTALAVLTLLKGGVPPTEPGLRRAIAYLRKLPMQKTYSVGILLMALDAYYAPARDPFVVEEVDRYGRSLRKDPCQERIGKADLAWMRAGVKFILDHQTADGVWRYPAKQAYDLSNTQYALLGLKAAVRCGIKIPAQAWLDALAFLLEHQEPTGRPVVYQANEVRGRYRIAWTERGLARGFRYVKRGPTAQAPPVSGSMTTAGLAGLIICQSELWTSRRFDGKLRLRTRRGIRDAMAWMHEHFDVSVNPFQPEKGVAGPPPGMRGGPNHFYYLYGLERASILGRIRHYGEHDWYEDGAELLMQDQSDDGSWPQQQRLVDSCFAILFLKRATTRMSVPVITPPSGRPPVDRRPGR